jgi:predicted enzyme related to lactoylglutathione lyase
VLLYSPEPEKLRAVFRDVFGWKHVDDGDGWLIFELPAAELGVHPSDGETHHQLSFMCDDVHATLAELRARGIEAEAEPVDAGYGITTTLVLPGGVRVQLYEPRHASPLA